jgi:GTP diphosphokinase / guanosine-3',5'-bis(diphosphate) 3'-diphosphatase
MAKINNLEKKEFEILNAKHILDTRSDWSQSDILMIEKAVKFAIEKHKEQERKSGEPYVNHVIETGRILSELSMDTTTIVAGVLHDTLEDTQTSETELSSEFSADVLKLVQGCTKLSKLKYHGVERHVESLRKFFIAMSDDIRVVIIKLADRLHNVKTLEYVREDKRQRIALETLEIHARLADRLGMSVLKTELETASFPYAYPLEYQKVKQIQTENTTHTENRIKEIEENLKFVLETEGIEYMRIDYRIKHLYSLYLKLKKYNWDINKIHDIVALRIIVKNMDDCYKTLGAIHSEYRPMPGRIKDYISLAKANGYKSLHTTVFTKDGSTAEVQIRTKEMHDEAEYGIASHLHYKEIGKNKGKNEIEKKTSWTKELLEIQKELSDKDEFLSSIKTDFFENRVFVFTPKGDVIDLPEGASAIDFAYAIHTDIGNKLSGAKVNGKLVSIDTQLSRGDMIEIIVGKNSKPSPKWIKDCKTTFAKKQITKFLELSDKQSGVTSIFSRILGRKK